MEVVNINSNFAKNVWDIQAFRRAYDVSLAIHRATLDFPKIEQFSLANQLRRATKSVCANIAEGFAKQPHSKAEFRRFLSIAIGSCTEIDIWLHYACDLEYISKDQFTAWQDEYVQITKMLQSFRNSIKENSSH